MAETKGKSPFYPGQPIPPDLFTGRVAQIKRIEIKGVKQVASGKPVALFIQGEYGIGKSSIANYLKAKAEKESGLHGIYVTLGRATSLDDVMAATLEGVVKSGSHRPDRSTLIQTWLGKYLKQLTLFGVTVNLEALKKEAATIASPHGLLSLLAETIKKLTSTGVKGIILIYDEINGITGNPLFVHFLKDLVETNAASEMPLPIFLILCGAEVRRSEMIRIFPPVGRIFSVEPIGPMDGTETRIFFTRSFNSVGITVDADAMDWFVHFSGGLPKIMHEIGDAAYYIDQDSRIDLDDAYKAISQAADEVGRKYVEPGVVDALKSRAYHSILDKLALMNTANFTRDMLVADLSPDEARKLDNFLRRLKSLNVIRSGETLGEYVFNVKLYQVYLTLKNFNKRITHDSPPALPAHPD